MIKLVGIGSVSTGKSSLLYRVHLGRRPEFISSTVGCGYLQIKLKYKDKNINLEAWDSAGSEKFRSLVPIYLRKTHIVLYVFDRSDINTFEDISRVWKPFVEKNLTLGSGFKEPIIFLIENKIDLPDRYRITTQSALYAEQQGWIYMRTSALTGEGIDELRERISEEIYKRVSVPEPIQGPSTIVDITDIDLGEENPDPSIINRCSRSVNCRN